MAEAEPENNEIKQRAVRRLLVAVVLVLVAVGILTYLSYYKPAKVVTKPTPETLPPPPPPIVTGPQPVQAAPTGEPLPELPPLPAPTETPPPVEPATTPPPPPSVTNKPLPPPGPGPKKTPAPAATQTQPQKPLVPAQNIPAPSATPAEAAAPKPVAAPTGYVVQFGVFSNTKNALQLVEKLKQAGIDAQTETRVQLPAFKTKAEAEAALARMREKGITATIVAR